MACNQSLLVPIVPKILMVRISSFVLPRGRGGGKRWRKLNGTKRLNG
jgi:hypothetical protein